VSALLTRINAVAVAAAAGMHGVTMRICLQGRSSRPKRSAGSGREAAHGSLPCSRYNARLPLILIFLALVATIIGAD
jgi:hypothetical protein